MEAAFHHYCHPHSFLYRHSHFLDHAGALRRSTLAVGSAFKIPDAPGFCHLMYVAKEHAMFRPSPELAILPRLLRYVFFYSTWVKPKAVDSPFGSQPRSKR